MSELSSSDASAYRFQDNRIYLERDVCFDRRHGQLLAGKRIVTLNLHENTLLQLLLADRVKKQRVIDAVWGANGTIVTEASYHQLVRSLRKKFDEAGLNPLSIKTLPRYGLEYLREHFSAMPAVLSLPQALATVRTATIRSGSAAAVTVMSALQRARPVQSSSAAQIAASAAPSAPSVPLLVRAYSEPPAKTGAGTEAAETEAAETEAAVGRDIEQGATVARRLPQWRRLLPFFMVALPFIVAFYFGVMACLAVQTAAQPIANDWGIHLFNIGGVQHDPLLMQEIRHRTQAGEYAYAARNGPKVWLGVCATPTQKEFSFCRQDYFSLY